ncbi:SPFH domain-containing protein [Patescibacteria group bacterium]|nr:SPFH domain-containing protein [Patescibacteria group bacterium]MBU2633229.1 SPFH domain-containing protein [Patescibacteria group bacterium]
MLSGLIVFGVILLTGAILKQGYRKIEVADPPQVAARTLFGRFTDKVAPSGWNYFFLCGWVQGFVPISIKTQDLDLLRQEVHTPDQAKSGISGKISWFFNEKSPRKFVNAGSFEGINKKLESIWEGIIKEWAIATEEGPQTFMELLGANEEATDLILKSMVRNNLEKIPSDIPTNILFRYFRKPFPKKPTPSQTKIWGAKWQKLEKIIQEEIKRGCYYSIEELENLVKKRKEKINGVRQGHGEFEKSEWSITIRLLNITKPEPLDEIAKAMQLEAKEAREAAAEEKEVNHFLKISDKLKKDGSRSRKDADEIVQTERGKIKKEIKELKLSIPDETVEKFGEVVANILAGRKK